MSRKSSGEDARVVLGNQLVVIHHRNSSQPIVVGVLGMDVDDDGTVHTVYLDRLVHAINQDRLGEWRVWGAVSSILERLPSAAPIATRKEAH